MKKRMGLLILIIIRINDTIPMCSKDDEYGIDLLKFVSVEDILTILKDYEKDLIRKLSMKMD